MVLPLTQYQQYGMMQHHTKKKTAMLPIVYQLNPFFYMILLKDLRNITKENKQNKTTRMKVNKVTYI